MCPEYKEEEKNKKNIGLTAANVILTAGFCALLWPLLRKGSLAELTLTADLLAAVIFAPLVLRPSQACTQSTVPSSAAQTGVPTAARRSMARCSFPSL